MLPRFSAVRCLVLTAPVRSSTQLPSLLSCRQLCLLSSRNCLLLLASLLSSHQLFILPGRVVNARLRPAPTALSWVASSTLIRVHLPLPDTARFHVQESFVWFRAKTNSSALAAYPHSATVQLLSPLPSCSTNVFAPLEYPCVSLNIYLKNFLSHLAFYCLVF